MNNTTGFSVIRNQLFSFVRKEFYHVLRDKKVLLILFGMPIVQVLLFGFVLSNEVKDTRIIVIDAARDEVSRQLIGKLQASRYFQIDHITSNESEIESTFRKGQIKAAIVFPINVEHDLHHERCAQVQVITDGTDINAANTMNGYIMSILQDFSPGGNQQETIPYRIVPEVRMLYNPQLLGAPNFVPGVMAMVLMLVCVMMTAVAIVKEKEMGTMEILLVSPMRPLLVIISKAVPYLLLSLVNLCIIILLSVYALDVPVKGSVVLLISLSTLFIITCLALGIFISIQTDSQQAAMFASLLGMLLPTIMLSGFMFPIENMPWPLQVISNIAPSRWYYIIVKDVMIKGAGFSSVWKETLVLATMSIALLVISMKKFKIRLA
jgi:ABC-2 type transport system permease protein